MRIEGYSLGIGGIIAILVIVAALVLFLIGRLPGEHAALFAALGIARLT